MARRKREPGGGRPKEIDDPVFRYTVTLDEKTVATIRSLGGGNFSLGIREAARILRQLNVVGK